ncbi:hypothetical protein ACDF64_17325 [Agromyces sp. MMS24-JH15]|uniref:hypothetical protein n=1 Tax=Agromyces sp. MMS24-JH15 TaxID=3243765 RepID=UPI003748F1B0
MSGIASGRAAFLEQAPQRRLEAVFVTPGRWLRIATTLSLVIGAVAMLIVHAELDRLISGAPSGARAFSYATAISPLAFGSMDAWTIWARGEWAPQIAGWIGAALVVDAVFIACYAILGFRVIRLAAGPATAARVLLWLLIAAEWCEALLIATLASGLTDPDGEGRATTAVAAAIASTAKWTLAVLVVVAIVRTDGRSADPLRRRIGRKLRQVGRGLWVHRLALLAVIALAALACVPSDDLFDQLPDIQRAWFDPASPAANLVHVSWAVLALAVAAFATFVLGRRRSRLIVETRARRLEHRIQKPGWAAALWGTPIVLLLAAAGFSTAVGGAEVAPWTSWTFWTLIGVGVVLLGFAVLAPRQEVPREGEVPGLARARAVVITGDVLAVAVVASGALGMVRSFTAPLAAAAAGSAGTAADDPVVWAVTLVCLLGAVGSPFLLRVGRRERVERPARWAFVDPFAVPRSDETVSVASVGTSLLLLTGVAGIAVALCWPTAVAQIGPAAIVLGGITAWVLAFGAFTLLAQSYRPIQPFGWLRFRANPVLTLGIVLPIVLGLVLPAIPASDGRADLHAVQVANAGVGKAVPTIAKRLADVVDAVESACAVTVGDGDDQRRVLPVYLVAAEGGGIRAAYWTTRVLSSLTGCPAASTLLSSGVSGGSIGLTLLATSPTADVATPEETPADAQALADARELAAGDTVGAAATGIVAGDLFATATGIRVPSYIAAAPAGDDEGGDGSDDPDWRWRDRAALVERSWEDILPRFGDQVALSAGNPRIGSLVLNSTDVFSACRVMLGLIDLEQSGGCQGSGTAADSRPLDSFVDEPAQCLTALHWSTYALLSARFPIVTPYGGFPTDAPCAGEVRGRPAHAQLVDGGMVENSGIGTLAELAPQVMGAFRDLNAARTGKADAPWVLPVVVYVSNKQGFDLQRELRTAASEAVTMTTRGVLTSSLVSDVSWLQRVTRASDDACSTEACHDALDDLRSTVPGGAVVVAPSSLPAVQPPLGWTLSDMTMAGLDAAFVDHCAPAPDQPLESGRSGRFGAFGRLSDLRALTHAPVCAEPLP